MDADSREHLIAYEIDPHVRKKNSNTQSRTPTTTSHQTTSNSKITCKYFILLAIIILSILLLVFYSLQIAPQNSSDQLLLLSSKSYHDNIRKYQQFRADLDLKSYKSSIYSVDNLSFDRIVSSPEQVFDQQANDVLVFVHIQKTAGTTFEKYLVKHLDIEHPCKCPPRGAHRKRCECFRGRGQPENWLFSRYSTGWACGLHADWTELVVQNCVENVLDRKHGERKRRYFFTSLLRDPINRTISEFNHVHRGATWATARHLCDGRTPTAAELPMCFSPTIGWQNVTLDEFLACPFNMARNRQTRMLADLTLVHCYNTTAMPAIDRDRIMLASAKRNLRSMSFFGLQERMADSQFMFESVFRLNFVRDLDDRQKPSKSEKTQVSAVQREQLESINQLDIALYQYATELFEQRLDRLRLVDGQ